jgi:hypothetical protein
MTTSGVFIAWGAIKSIVIDFYVVSSVYPFAIADSV